MNKNILNAVALAGIMLGLAGAARAGETAPLPRAVALGASLDLAPAALSAAAGAFGLGGQAWLGIDHVRVRLAAAKTLQPEFLLNSDYFHRQKVTSLAMLYDYTFGENFDKWWVGAGLELWMSEIENKVTLDRIYWDSGVFTAGGGYIFRLPKNFYLDLGAAGHLVLNNRRLVDPVTNPETQIADSITLQPFSGEVSLKFGWFFNVPARTPSAPPARGGAPAPPPAKGGTVPPKRTP